MRRQADRSRHTARSIQLTHLHYLHNHFERLRTFPSLIRSYPIRTHGCCILASSNMRRFLVSYSIIPSNLGKVSKLTYAKTLKYSTRRGWDKALDLMKGKIAAVWWIPSFGEIEILRYLQCTLLSSINAQYIQSIWVDCVRLKRNSAQEVRNGCL
jgi:hypothetical protein